MFFKLTEKSPPDVNVDIGVTALLTLINSNLLFTVFWNILQENLLFLQPHLIHLDLKIIILIEYYKKIQPLCNQVLHKVY